MQNKNSKIIYNTGALYIRMAVTMVISFFTARVTLNVLGVEDYGLNNLVGGVVAMFSFINLSMGTAVQRFYSIEIGKKDNAQLFNVFGTGVYMHLIIAAITLLIAEIFAFFFLERMNIPPERLWAAQVVFQVSTLSLLLNIINVPYAAFLRAKEEFSKMALVDIIQALSRLLVLFFLCRIDYDKLIVFSILNLAVTLFYVIAINRLARKFSETSFHINRDFKLLKLMLSFTSLIILSVFAKLFRDQGIIVLLNLFFGLAINAAYAISINVQNILDTFTLSFKQSVVPQLTSSYSEGNFVRMNKLIYTSTKITFLLSVIIGLPLIFESQYILELWLINPPKYSAEYVSIVIFNLLISSFPYFLTQGIHATGQIKKLQIFTSFNLIFNIILAYTVLKLEGNFFTVIYTVTISSIISNLINICYAKRIIKLDYRFFIINIIGKCTLLLVVVTFILFFLHVSMDKSMIRLLVIILFTFLSVLIGGYYIILDNEEKDLTRHFSKEMGNKLSKFFNIMRKQKN